MTSTLHCKRSKTALQLTNQMPADCFSAPAVYYVHMKGILICVQCAYGGLSRNRSCERRRRMETTVKSSFRPPKAASLCLCLSACLFVSFQVRSVSAYLHLDLLRQLLSVSVSLRVCFFPGPVCLCLSSFRPPKAASLCLCLSACLFVSFQVRSVSASICVCLYLPACLPVSLSVCLCIYVFVFLSVSLCVEFPSAIRLLIVMLFMNYILFLATDLRKTVIPLFLRDLKQLANISSTALTLLSILFVHCPFQSISINFVVYYLLLVCYPVYIQIASVLYFFL